MKVLRLGDKYIQHVLKLVSHRDYRFSKETCVVTGTKLVRDLGKRYRFKEIICSRPSHPDLWNAIGTLSSLSGLSQS